jgi:outer membrane protein assembly factor BamA
MKRLKIVLWILLFPTALLAADISPVVTSITITDNRVQESIVRKKLAFKIGDALDDAKLAQSRANLFSLGLFKTLDIQQNPDGHGGVAVTVKAKDGWFILPWVMAGSRGGERYTGAMLMEQNYFSHAEKLMYFGMYQDSISFDSFAAMFPDFGVSASFDRRNYTEYRYTNGSYNSSVLVGRELDKLQDFGAISDSYNRNTGATKVTFNLPLSRDVRASAGINANTAQYSPITGSAPINEGSSNALQLGFACGRSDGGRDFSGSFARIFGMGMADLQENFKPLPCAKSEWGFQANVEGSSKDAGSDNCYAKESIVLSRETKYCGYSRLLLSARFGAGSDAPFSQLFATNRSCGMLGVYAREFRGDTFALVSANYRYPLARNRTGTLNADFFGEAAALTWQSSGFGKQGAGCNITWQFWRFPLPIGIGYTYCLDDQNWQTSFAIGGMF